jgi:hypothetical protein
LAAVFSIHRRDQFERLRGSENLFLLLFFPDLERIEAVCDQASRVIAARACLGQGDGGVDPQCERFAFAEVAVVEAPVLPGRRHEQVHADTVRVLLAGRLGGFCGEYEGVGECHGSTPIPVTVFSFKKLRYTVKFYGIRAG